MASQILQINPIAPELDKLSQAADLLRRGGVVATPTDTVYGLVADPANQLAVERIYHIKGRDYHLPLILLISDMTMLAPLYRELPNLARVAVAHFWPGALTIILEKSPAVPDFVVSGGSSVGVRLPAHPVLTGLVAAAGFPLASTSANPSGQPPATSAAQVAALGDAVDLILDAGPAPLGVASSVLDCTTVPPRLLREGSITRAELARLLGQID